MIAKESLLRRLGQAFCQNDDGGVAVIFGLMVVPVLAFIGLGIDYARAVSTKSHMQSSLDAAVLGARNTAMDQQQAFATALFKANYTSPISSASATFSRETNGKLSGRAVSSLKTTFSSVINIKSFDLSVSAAATPDSTITTGTPGGIPCIHVMSQSDQEAFYLNSNSSFDGSRCEVHVRSNRTQAMRAISSSKVSFKKILVKGGASVESGAIQIADAPYTITENADVVGDPYLDAIQDVESLIATGSCAAANTDKTFTGGAVNPGTYCGATSFNGVRFNSGLYIIKSGSGNKNGALTLKGKLDGSAGVTFYFADNQSRLAAYQGGEDSVLAAPTSGTTRGILMFESSNRGPSGALTIRSVNKQSWTGLVYFPSLDLTLDSLSEWKKVNIALAVNRLKMISLSTFIMPFDWTPSFASNPIRLPGEEVTSSLEGWLVD